MYKDVSNGQHNLIVITVDQYNNYSVATKQVFCCSIEVTCLYINTAVILLLLVHYQVSKTIININAIAKINGIVQLCLFNLPLLIQEYACCIL